MKFLESWVDTILCIVQEPQALRQKKLEDSKDLQLFLKDTADEQHTIKAVVFSPNRGNSVTEAQSLQRTHQGLQSEVEAASKRVRLLSERATALQEKGLHHVLALAQPFSYITSNLNLIAHRCNYSLPIEDANRNRKYQWNWRVASPFI